MGEEGEEEEEGLEDIQEPSVIVAQAGRADGQEVSRKIIPNYNLISYWEAKDCQGTDYLPTAVKSENLHPNLTRARRELQKNQK